VSTVGRVLGAAGILSGLLGAAALGGMTAQRVSVRKVQTAQAALLEAEPELGNLPADRSYSVVADDGVRLYVEEVGPTTAPVTIVFPHGWTLRMGSWHFQRLGLRGPGFGTGAGTTARLVFYDQRSHGKSGRAPEGHSTMEHLASDLRQVLATAAPTGPIALIGHSMGGMAILTFAAADPEFFAERVVGVGLLCTGATYLAESPLNQLFVIRANPVVRAVTSVAARFPAVFERGRATNRDAVWLLTRTLGFARKDVSGRLVDYLDEMISGTPVDVIAEYAPTLFAYDQAAAVPALAGIPTVIVAGDQDRMTPLARSQAIADVLPDAEFVVAPGSGHLALMEDPELINDALRRMLERSVLYGRGRAARRPARR
jgi:pimeloyl-ACP methyl ester carboxylesterase